MKREYDFSNAERGKFYKRGAKMCLPIYLDARLQKKLERAARRKGQDIGEMANQMLRKEARLIEDLEPTKGT